MDYGQESGDRNITAVAGRAVHRLNEQLAIEWIYSSHVIESSTLSLRETQMVLKHGIAIGGKSRREHFE